MGGKFHLAKKILKTFPPANQYDIYVEPFGGAGHVLIQKPKGRHAEIFNDINNDLVNFWLHCRDSADELVHRLETLPYARSVYYTYHKSLYDGTQLEPLERATRWFYVLRSSFRPEVSNIPNGWNSGPKSIGIDKADVYYNALSLFKVIASRFRHVEIDNRDFEQIIKQHESPRTLIYCDPPYIDAEGYYQSFFTQADHERLAFILNASPAMIALSYYPHPQIDKLYPVAKWRRITWQTVKHSQRTKETHDVATEMLLCNYPVPTQSLWDTLPNMEEDGGAA
jgi:DNA adenine methylase